MKRANPCPLCGGAHLVGECPKGQEARTLLRDAVQWASDPFRMRQLFCALHTAHPEAFAAAVHEAGKHLPKRAASRPAERDDAAALAQALHIQQSSPEPLTLREAAKGLPLEPGKLGDTAGSRLDRLLRRLQRAVERRAREPAFADRVEALLGSFAEREGALSAYAEHLQGAWQEPTPSETEPAPARKAAKRTAPRKPRPQSRRRGARPK
jgi:hypothetical protein